MLKTKDDHFVVVGTTQSESMKGPDIWIGKISDKPRLQWSRTLRNNNDFVVNKIVPTSDKQYAILASAYGKEKENCRSYVFKVDKEGQKIWEQHYSTYAWEEAVDMIATTDGGFLIGGHIKSNVTSPLYYAWIAKLDSKGIMQWNSVFDLFDMGAVQSLIEVKDGFVLQGNIAVDRQPNNTDAWLIKVNHSGNSIWEKTYGDYGKEEGFHLIPTRDGGFAFCGYTTSTGEGKKDAWLVKTNAKGELQWEKTFGTYNSEYANRMLQLDNNSFVLTGSAKSHLNNSMDAWMVWTDEEGEKLGEQFHGGLGDDEAYDLLNKGEDELVMVGYSTSKTNSYYHEPFIANYKMRFDIDFQQQDVNFDNPLASVSAARSFSTSNVPTKPVTFSNFDTPTPAFTFRVPDLHVLSIGTNPPDLDYTEKDAIDFANVFKNQGNKIGAGNKLFNDVQTVKLIGEDANTQNIKMAVEALQRKTLEGAVKPNDVVIIFISAHGFLLENRLRIQASDYNYNSPKATSIRYDELLEDLELIDCKKILFIDACHSASPNADYAAKASVGVVNNAIHQISQTKRGLTVITSSNTEEQSYEDRKAKNGFFTKALIQGLKGEADYNTNDIITLTELFTFVQQRVPTMVGLHTKQRQNPQMIRNDLGDLPIYVTK